MEKIIAYLQRRRSHYRLALLSPAGRQVLADLMQFCCVNSTTERGDSPHQMAIREGRRQVFLRVQRALMLTPEQLLAISDEKDKPQ